MILYYFIEFQSHSMNESGKRVFRRQAFRDAWLQDPDFASWLQKCDDPYKASCIACKRSFIAGKSELLKHKKTLTHTIRMRKRRGGEEEEEEGIVNDSLTTFERNVRKAELRFCMDIVEHNGSCLIHMVTLR